MNHHTFKEAQGNVPIDDPGARQQRSRNAEEVVRSYVRRGSIQPPSIPKTIALILGTMLLAIFLATHWPFNPLWMR
jgi:hypothetical protein